VLRGEPLVGAIVGAINQLGNVVGGERLNFQQLFRTGAFDLAKRINLALRDLPRGAELLRPNLSEAERQLFEI
jgi:hypothetical protein